MHLRQNKRRKNEQGTILMEAIICLPALLLVSLGVAQFAHIWLCRTMVQYAAYCGARATLTAPSNKEAEWARHAAEVVCAPIAFLNPDSSDNANDFVFPGIIPPNPGNNNSLQGSGCVKRNDVLAVNVSKTDDWHRRVQVSMKVPLLFPLAGPVIGKIMRLYDEEDLKYAPQGCTPDGIDPVTAFANERNRGIARFNWTENVYIVKPFLTTWNESD